VKYGLEAGSKPELLLAMAQEVQDGVPLVLNGFKDEEFMTMAHHAAELGHDVVVVLESLQEVDRYIDVTTSREWKAFPRLGFRAKLYTRGSGRWQGSGGELAKFGLTTVEMLEVLRRLDAQDLRSRMVLMHFHIGSQITQIKRIKRATREAIRLWAALRETCPELRLLDIGGGIGVDYDGSKTSYESSANYDLEEYASQVVYEIVEVCNELEVEHPVILTESGRVLVSEHAVTITDLREVQGELVELPPETEDEDRNIQELRYALEHITVKRLEEYFHDAQDLRDQAINLFAGGHLSLTDRAKAEGLFHRIRLKAEGLMRQMPKKPVEIVDYLDRAQRKYLANFSAFQSLPDSWAIDQVFPAAPLSRYGEPATVNASIVDITCDSDGCIKNFAHPEENLKWLPLHEPNGEAYYLGFFMTGAYQDSLANEHNLYSRCHEVLVHPADFEAGVHRPGTVILEGDGVILEVRSGMTNEESLLAMDFEAHGLTTALRQRHAEADTTLGLTWPLGIMRGYPYLRARAEVEES
jgi:arginine decarboxylase